MAKAIRSKSVGRSRKDIILPLEKKNFLIIGAGLISILLGYIALLEKTVEGFLPLTAGPLLLVLGYCVLIPLGILYTVRAKAKDESRIEKPV